MTHLTLGIRENLFRNYGNFALAYSATHQPDLLYFGDERGALAYRIVGKSALVLSNPLAPEESWPGLIDRFVANMGDVSFWQVSRPVAALLASRGFLVNPIGSESRLDLRTYSFKGQKKRSFRTAENRMAANGMQTREMAASDVDARHLQAISEQWRKSRTVKSRELTFLIRPVALGDENGVRKFFTFDRKDTAVAFASFDPVCEDGQTIGYLLATKRWLPQTDPLVGYGLARCAIEAFQAEGLAWLLLGNSPLAQVKDKDFKYSRTVKQGFHFARNSALFNRFVYSVQGISVHKAIYFGTTQTTYCAFNRRPGLARVFKMVRACGIV